MDEVKFYISIFLRRLHWFLIVATVISAVSVMVALTLPPSYVSQMRLVVESPQIPEELAASTVNTPAYEQLQIIQQRLQTRENMLSIARRFDVLPDLDEMNPDQIVQAMRARTNIRITSGRDRATMMTVSFEAPNPRNAAAVLNEYLTIIQEFDAAFRRGAAGETLDFFQQEVTRLGQELDAKSVEILTYKQANSEDLPDSLDFRMSQRSELQERLLLAERDIVRLEGQRERLVQLFEATGQTTATAAVAAGTPQRAPSLAEQQLDQLTAELNDALAVFSEENPKVKILRTRIANLEAQIATEAAERSEAAETAAAEQSETDATAAAGTISNELSLIDLQIAEIDSEIEILQKQAAQFDAQVLAINASITRTPEVAIRIDELERAYAITENQYNKAEARLSQAQTGDLIESRSRGQRISVIDQPNIPTEPEKPNRPMIAAAGIALGVGAGGALVVLLELLNGAVRRPEDLVSRFGISPFTTIPYIRTKRQMFVQRTVKLIFILAILTGIPAGIYAVHTYYLPVDLLAERVMNRFGIRL